MKVVKLKDFMHDALQNIVLKEPAKRSHHPTGPGSTAERKKYRTGQHELYKEEWENER